MKKKIMVCLYAFIMLSAFAEKLDGIFGIPFGTNQSIVKQKMSEKGWNFSDKNKYVSFKKEKGTYAKLLTEEIKLYFYNDKLWEIVINFKESVSNSDILAAFEIIKNSYGLKYSGSNNYSIMQTEVYSDDDTNYFCVNTITINNKIFFGLQCVKIKNENITSDL